MIIKFEYVMNNVFSEKVFYYIEYLEGNYYYSNNSIAKIKINNEKAIKLIEEVLGNISLIKEESNFTIMDNPVGYITVLKENGKAEKYSSEKYRFSLINEILKNFDSKVMKFKLEQ